MARRAGDIEVQAKCAGLPAIGSVQALQQERVRRSLQKNRRGGCSVNRTASGDLLEFLHRWGGRLGLLKPSTAAVQSMANHIFFLQLMEKTNNFTNTRWLGREIRQNVLDLWVIQETISDLRPELLIETGTHEGGSAL